MDAFFKNHKYFILYFEVPNHFYVSNDFHYIQGATCPYKTPNPYKIKYPYKTFQLYKMQCP